MSELAEDAAETVWLHGFTGSPASWDEVAPAGVADWRPALLGHGADPPRGPRSFVDEIDRLEALAAARVRAPRLMVGYSMGARVGLGWLLRHEHRFEAAVLVGAHPGLATEADRERRRLEDQRWADLLTEHGLDRFVEAWSARSMFASQGRVEPDRLARQDAIRRSHDPHGLAVALAVLGLGAMPCWGSMLTRTPCRVLFVAGALDRHFAAQAAEMAAAAPHARVVELEGCGHNPLLEAPLELAGLIAALRKTCLRGEGGGG